MAILTSRGRFVLTGALGGFSKATKPTPPTPAPTPSEGLAISNSYRTDKDGNDIYQIDGRGNCRDNDIVIPSITADGHRIAVIKDKAFAGDGNLYSVYIPDDFSYIDENDYETSRMGEWAFHNCEWLTSVRLPTTDNVLLAAGGNMRQFAGCTRLTDITIGGAWIDNYVFYGCTNLTTAKFTNLQIEEIGRDIFTGCTKLTDVYVYAPVPPTLGTNAFPNNTELKIHVPASSLSAYKAKSKWSTYASKMVGDL